MGIFTTGNLIVLAIAVLVFFVLREVFTWYWKINRIVNLLEQIEGNTRPSKANDTPTKDTKSTDQSQGNVWRDGKWENK